MTDLADEPDLEEPARPIPETYWIVPGRLLVGEYPGSPSRASAMDRLRRFVDAGVTCFIDLTEPGELPSYEPLLPLTTADGRRIECMREPIVDHGVPGSRDDMARTLETVDEALDAGHVVYLHCRAGIGRSSLVAGCWLASRGDFSGDALEELQRRWSRCAKSAAWRVVPETVEQSQYVRDWQATARGEAPAGGIAPDAAQRVRGALLGMAAGDAAGHAHGLGRAADGAWTQHTALTLCLAESLLERGGFDARDQVERYVKWHKKGRLSADGRPGDATPDVAKALATYQWRHQPMAGSHDPRDRSTASLPRVLAAAAFAMSDPVAAVRLAGEVSRTTHQSPYVLDACRYLGALLVGALRGARRDELLAGLYEPAPGLWAARPLKKTVSAAIRKPMASAPDALAGRPRAEDAVQAVVRARDAFGCAPGFEEAVQAACRNAADPALEAAIAGALYGAVFGAASLPRSESSRLKRADLLDEMASRLARAATTKMKESGACP